MKAYSFEIYADRLIARGVCSDAPAKEVERWMNAQSKRVWSIAENSRFQYVRELDAEQDPDTKAWHPIPDMPPKSPIPCPDGRDGHQHFILRSGQKR